MRNVRLACGLAVLRSLIKCICDFNRFNTVYRCKTSLVSLGNIVVLNLKRSLIGYVRSMNVHVRFMINRRVFRIDLPSQVHNFSFRSRVLKHKYILARQRNIT